MSTPIPTWSLCHPCARLPQGWRNAALTWLNRSDHPELVEHILATDSPLDNPMPVFENTKLIVNTGRRDSVTAWNAAGRASSGKVILAIADDLYPPEHWDSELLKVIPDLDKECVIEVAHGGNDNILSFAFMTRPYYERFCYIFYPEYLGMRADDEFSEVARMHGVIVNARHLYFEHRHPFYSKGDMDDVYRHQHRPESYELGDQILSRRRQEGFPNAPVQS